MRGREGRGQIMNLAHDNRAEMERLGEGGEIPERSYTGEQKERGPREETENNLVLVNKTHKTKH